MRKYQFNANFVRYNLIPLLVEILSDISEDQPKKGKYLKRLLVPDKLTEMESREFEREYFTEKIHEAMRPFTGFDDEDKRYREYFLDDLTELMRERVKLSSVQGVKEALLPGKNRSYGTSGILTENINRMAYRMVNNFQQRQIEMRIKTDYESDNIGEGERKRLTDLNTSGELILADVGGEEFIMSREEIEKADASIQVTPLIAPDLGESVSNDFAQTQPPATNSAVETAAPAHATLGEIRGGIRHSQASSMEKLLESAGLSVVNAGGQELIGGLKDTGDGMLEGYVKDKKGNILKIKINTNAASADPEKFQFEFKKVSKQSREAGIHENDKFHLSQKDINPDLFRLGVDAAYKKWGSPDRKKPREEEPLVNIPNVIPFRDTARSRALGLLLATGGNESDDETPEDGTLTEGGISVPVKKGKKPQIRPQTAPGGRRGNRENATINAPPQGGQQPQVGGKPAEPPAKPPTIAEEKRKKEEERARAFGGGGVPQARPDLRQAADGGEGGGDASAQTKKMNRLQKALITFAAGSAGTATAAITAGAYETAVGGSESDTINQVSHLIHLIASIIGLPGIT